MRFILSEKKLSLTRHFSGGLVHFYKLLHNIKSCDCACFLDVKEQNLKKHGEQIFFLHVFRLSKKYTTVSQAGACLKYWQIEATVCFVDTTNW